MHPKKVVTESVSPLSSREGSPHQQFQSNPEDEERTREDLEQLQLKDQQSQSEEPQRHSQGQVNDDDEEDVVMQEANPIKEPLSPTISKKKDPVLVLKKVIARRDSYFNLYTDMMNTEASDEKSIRHLNEIRAKVEGLNKDISVLKNSVRLSDEKVTASVESAMSANSNGGIRLSKQDLPKFQLKSSSTKYFPKDESYESVNHFLRSFEKVISSSGENVEAIWKRYIPLTLPYELDNWLNNDVMACRCWAEVGAAFNKKFGNNAMLKLQSRREVFNAKMHSGESTEAYTTRFTKAVTEANYSLDNTTIGDAFLTGFPEEWQTQINTVLLCNHTDRDYWTIDEIHMAAINIYNSKLAPFTFVNKVRAALPAEATGQQSKRFKSTIKEATTFFCPNHGGAAAKHNEKDCYNNKAGSASSAGTMNNIPSNKSTKFLGNKNVPRKATGNTFCKWCGKLWFFGHVCQEYNEKKHSNNVSVLTIQSENKENKKKGKGKAVDNEKLFRENMEQDSYCELKLNKQTKEFKLITPLLLNKTRVIGKVDPGADISFINKTILNKDFKDVKNMKTLGYLNFLSVNEDGSNNRTKRIGQTEPMEVTYLNGITFKHQFEIVEFNDEMKTEFDILLGIDILPKLGIYLSGVAHAWPDDTRKELSQFENVNYDLKNEYDPENADYGTPEVRTSLMQSIQNALDKNTQIKPDAICSMKESVVQIPIDDPSDCFVRQYPLPVNAHTEIKAQLKEWIDNGVVQRTKPSSVFHSPLLCVPKKDLNGKPTKLRICCDLRRINAAISKNYHENYAVPKINEIFDKVSANARIISKIDLHQAYMSYGVHENSREALTFSYNGLFYHWSRAPYGLKFMSSLFVKCMSILLNDVHIELQKEMQKEKAYMHDDEDTFYGDIAHYVDDCVLYTVDTFSHVKLINIVINRLTSVNLRINVEKCTWFQTSVFLLGFVVGPGITKIDMRLLSDIDSWPTPTTAKQVKSIMGIISHLRDYVPMLSKIAAPIDQLRNDSDVKNKWTQLHTDRLNTIKQILLSNQILHTPVLGDKFFLQVDASLYGIAACLYQKDEVGRIKHIGFVSKSLNQAERNWSTNRRETAAIIFGLQKFRSLLWGHSNLEILTDHIALTYMFTSTNLNSTLQNYLEILSEYDFTISHVKGIDNVLSDALSRLYPPIEEDTILDEENQKQMKRLQRFILVKRANSKSEIVRSTKVYSKDKNLNVLAIKLNNEEFQTSITDYVCPREADRAQIIKDAHDVGHFGVESCVQHIHSYYALHWKSIYQDVKKALLSCRECALHNVSRKGFNPARSIVSFQTMDHVAFDLCGPLPVTDKGNVYILVMIDLCTRYIVARPIPNKSSTTVAQAIIGIFGDYGVSLTVAQSDNGREWSNTLMHLLTKTLSIQHRFSTPYYSQSNGSVENAIKTVTQTLRKMCGNDTRNWDDRLPICQLVINMKIKQRTASTPFSLMFARQVSTRRSTNDLNLNGRKSLSIPELLKRAEYMNSIVFPAIQERTTRLMEEYNKKIDKKNLIIDIPFDTPVMVRLKEGRESKLAPLYAGPYVVARKTKAGNYVLRDEKNELLHREYTPSELKIVSLDETAIEEESFEVEDIRDHRTNPSGIMEYLVKWAGYGERENEWITADLFNSSTPIRNYWKKVKQHETFDKERRQKLAEQNNTSISKPNKQTSTPSKRKRVNNVTQKPKSNNRRKTNPNKTPN
ncbi:conserved hypothetical protein [Mucor ambiguus]|uniref:RNA-directed DNA polymerase n=1 Tax=Mucor ambiguus TaxID=91626 RepID=A0A0C9N9K4_9FUNG|nr:conserved hypothetical protein [Mucor ambiguus]